MARGKAWGEVVRFVVSIGVCWSCSTAAPLRGQRAGGGGDFTGGDAACEAVRTDPVEWLRAAASAILPKEESEVLRMAGGYNLQLRNQSERPAPPYIAAPSDAQWWFDLSSGDLVVDRGAAGALGVPGGARGVGADLRGLVPWAVLHDWLEGGDEVGVVGRCTYLGYSRIVLRRPGEAGPEQLVLDAASAVPVAMVRHEVDPLLGPERAEYRYQGWWSVGSGRYPVGATRYLDGEEAEARTLYPPDMRLVARDSLPTPVTMAGPRPLPVVDTVRIGDGAFLLRSARFTEAVMLSADTVVLMDVAAGEDRARADSVWIARLFPGPHPVVVVVSSLAWPHFLGMRWWAARGADVVTHTQGVDFLRDVLERTWDAAPDLLERVRDSVVPRVTGVDKPTAIAGGGAVLRPVRGVTGEVGLLVFLPRSGFLWSSDRIQVIDETTPYVEDLVWSVREDGLSPRTTSGPHLGLVPWATLDALAAGDRPPVPAVSSMVSDSDGAQGAARTLVLDGAEAMGGLESLRALRGMRIGTLFRENLVGVAFDAKRPMGLWGTTDELRDVASASSRLRASLSLVVREGPIETETVHAGGGTAAVAGGSQRALPPEQGRADQRGLVLAPERMLLTALSAPDLKAIPDVSLDGERYPAVSFDGGAVRILFHPRTHLPVALEQDTTLDADYTWSVWGDVTTRTIFGRWSLEPEGVRYPRSWRVERNGHPLRTVAVTALDLSAAVAPDSFPMDVPPSERPASAVPAPVGPSKVVELRPGVVLLDGYFNVLLVAQEDGVVVVEPPHSSAYSEAVLEEASRRFPDLPIKAVVATSFLWPHLGGVRPYVARGIPIYLPEANEAVVREMARAPHRRSPDAQSRAAAAPVLRAVRGRVVLGTGASRIELHYEPVRGGDHSRRMMVAHLPEQRLLHAGDLFLPERFEPTMWTQALDELNGLVRDRGLDVEAVTALHIEETPWQEVGGSRKEGG